MATDRIMEIFTKTNAIITGDHFVYARKSDGWYHGDGYVNKDAVYPYTDYCSYLAKEIALHFLDSNVQTVVGPAMGGGILAQWVAYWLNHYMYEFLFKDLKPSDKVWQPVLAVYADEEDILEQKEVVICYDKSEFLANGMVKIEGISYSSLGVFNSPITYQSKVGTRRVIKRGYDIHVNGKNCLKVDDVTSSGETMKKTEDAIIKRGGRVVGAGVLCNRSGGKVSEKTLGTPFFSLLDIDLPTYKEEECPICREKGVQSVRTDLGKGKEFLARIGKI